MKLIPSITVATPDEAGSDRRHLLSPEARASLEAKDAADRLLLTTPVATTKPASDGRDRATIAGGEEALTPGAFSEEE